MEECNDYSQACGRFRPPNFLFLLTELKVIQVGDRQLSPIIPAEADLLD